MSRALKLLRQGARFCSGCVLAFAIWTLWLALGLLLVAQVYVVSTNELEVPGFLLRTLEDRLAASGLRATFGRTSFDPTGRVLIEDVQLSLPAFAEPVIKARTLYVQFDPWALAAGRFEPREMRVTGASLAVPAMLSRSGAAEEILAGLDATFVPADQTLAVAQFSGRIAGIAVSAHGAVHLPSTGTAPAAPLPVADFLAHNFSSLCRQLDAFAQQLAALDQPGLHLELAPSESRVAIASLTLDARGWKLGKPVPLEARGLRIATRFPLFGGAPTSVRLEVSADDLTLPFAATAHGVHASVRGALRSDQLDFEPHEFELSAESLAAGGFSVRALVARLTPGPLPQLKADIVAALMGAPLAVRAQIDLAAQTADLRFEGPISPAVLSPLSDRLGVDVRQYFNFTALDCTEGAVRLGTGWKFEGVTAHVVVSGIDAYHVHMDEGRAIVGFDGRRFYSPDAWARIGENFAQGTYDHNLQTRDFRFLLQGQLRPLDISGWFSGGWWTSFFQQFEFPVAPPTASVDVIGRWGDGRRAAVFVYADTVAPVIRGAKLDRARTRLFIRPAFYDGLEIYATSGTGTARGTFTYRTDPATFEWRSLEFDLASSLDLAVGMQIIGPAGQPWFEPFKFAQPPALKLAGRIDGAAAPGGAHQTLTIEARSAGEFRLHDFPLENIAFTAALHDTDVSLDNLRAGFAGGVATGRAHVRGAAAERRLSFDLTLKDASLGRAAAVLEAYAARSKGLPPPAPGKFVQEKANVRLDLTASAEGRYSEPMSYLGEGTAALQGGELSEVPLLGPLSDLLKFTELRFTTAHASFKIDGPKLLFSEFNLRGANSAIDAHGAYALDRKELDFKAKLYPFHESGNVIKSVLKDLLKPLSSVFEIVLTGSLDKPSWAFAIGPTSLLRSIAPGETPPSATKPDETTAPPASAPPPESPPATDLPPSPSPAKSAD